MLGDFGVAAVADASGGYTSSIAFSRAHVAPEVLDRNEFGPSSDVYSLGVVAYECLAGRLPFPGENAVAMAMSHVRDTPGPLPADVPPEVAAM